MFDCLLNIEETILHTILNEHAHTHTHETLTHKHTPIYTPTLS